MNRVFNSMKKLLTLLACAVAITGCGVNNNVTANVTNGQCANGISNAPYCMSVQIMNNGGGQNFITSTNFPISSIGITVSNVSNIQSPATNTSTFDPNNCTGSTISPGGTCTFYLQLSQEAFAVSDQESVQITINYTVNNTLFGGSTTTGSSTFTIYELTNLYTMQNIGNLTIYNAAWTSNGQVESIDTANSTFVDTSSYGLLYIGGNLGIYPYSVSNNELQSSIGNSTATGANNLFLGSSGTMFTTNIAGSSNYGVYSYSLSGESWTGTTYSYGNQTAATNANATGNSNIFIGGASSLGTANNTIYYCPINTSSSCGNEGNVGLSGGIHSLSFLNTVSQPYSGLYAGTTSGLYIESGVSGSSSTTWSLVTDGPTAQVNVIATAVNESGVNILVAGDALGKLWIVSADNPSKGHLTAASLGSAITAMAFDQFGGVMYVGAGNAIYACINIGAPTEELSAAVSCTQIISSLGYNSTITGMGIGSYLTGTTSSPGQLQQ